MLKRFIYILSILILLSITIYGQATTHTAFRFRQGPSLPSTCSIADIFYLTSNSTFYGCGTLNTWTSFAITTTGGGGGVSGSATYDPPSLLNGQSDTVTVTVTGAVVGDVATSSFSVALPTGVWFSAPQITSANTAKVTLVNESGSTQDVASGTLKISTVAAQLLFSSIPVSGQTTVTANSATTALTLVAGTGMTITTDNTAKSVTFASSGVIASGTASMGTTAVGSGACSSVIDGGTATGVATTDTIVFTVNADPTGATGYAPSANGGLHIWAYPTASHVNFKLCNDTASSITPQAITLNWKVFR